MAGEEGAGVDQAKKRLEESLFGALENVDKGEGATNRGEFFGAVLDMMEMAGVDLKKGCVQMSLPADERNFPYGTDVSFTPLAVDKMVGVGGVFVCTRGIKDSRIGGVIVVEADDSSGRNERVVNRVRFSAVELSPKQMLAAVGSLAMSVMARVEN